MNNLVDISDFKGFYSIPLYFEGNTDFFNEVIKEYQYDFLINALGVELYTAFETGLTQPTIEQRWINLRDGLLNYTSFSGCKQNYRGLKAILVPYCFSRFCDDNEFKQTQIGITKLNAENSQVANSYDVKVKQFKAWNEFVMRNNIELFDFMYTYESDYSNFTEYFNFYNKKGILSKSNIM